ncbi:MAG: 50S ribosomal protein L9 [Treponema sp.]|nr:50S ribosomal protein L9 [Treponema sp.]
MKVILNKDLATLGEEGDVKDVARGYARNYLFPRGIALPYTPQTIKLFEARKGEIEARKTAKRQDALGIKERLENLEISVTMPAGANGKLYGAVTPQTVADELGKQGFDVDRKRIDLSATSIKVVGKYKATVRLYENSRAEIQLTVIGQEIKTESPRAPARPARRRRDEGSMDESVSRDASASDGAPVSGEAPATDEAVAEAPAVSEPEPASGDEPEKGPAEA